MAITRRHKSSRNGDFAKFCKASCIPAASAGLSTAAARQCNDPKSLWNGGVSVQGTYLVLSESMVWKSFSSSSSLSVPSEKKAWNSSRDSFPSSANSNTATVRERAKQGTWLENQELCSDLKIQSKNYLQVLLLNGPSSNAELTGYRIGPSSSGALKLRCSWVWMHWLLATNWAINPKHDSSPKGKSLQASS